MRRHKQPLMKILMLPCCLTAASMLPASTTSADENRMYQTDSVGNIQYHKPSYTVRQDERIIETDSVGNRQYQKPQYQIKGDWVYQTDSVGNIQYDRPRSTVK